MANRTIGNFKSTVDSLFPDNTAKQITPDRVRSILYDAADSFLFSIKRKAIDVTGSTITLDWELLADTALIGTNGVGALTAINADKTIAVSNITNAVTGSWTFSVTGTRILTMPATFFLPSFLGNWVDSTKALTLDPGFYRIDFVNNGTNFYLTLNGPY